MKLGKISEISIGIVLSRIEKEEDGKKYKVLTLKSFNENGLIYKEDLDELITNKKISDKHITKVGDVLIRLSEPNTAVYITKEYEGIVIPSQFNTIRIKEEWKDKLSPEYLTVYLNSLNFKREIIKNQLGSVLKVISTSFLKDLNIDILLKEKEEQGNFVELNSLIDKEIVLLEKLLKEKKELKEKINYEHYKK